MRFEPQTNRPLDLALMVDASGSAAFELKIERRSRRAFRRRKSFVRVIVWPSSNLQTTSPQLSNFSDDSKLQEARCAAWTWPGAGHVAL